MMHTTPYKTKHFFFVLIKICIVVGAFYFIYAKIANNTDLDFSSFIYSLNKNDVISPKNIVLLLFLSFLNWFLEILKWQTLVSSIKNISLKDAAKQSLGSLTASLLTPNRIGEYGAKAMFYTTNHRKQIVLINMLSNFLQMGVTTIFGGIGLYLLTTKYQVVFNYYKLMQILLIGICLILLTVFVLKKSTIKIKGFSLEKLKFFAISFPKKNIATGFIFSLLRYIIFSFQFYYLLTIFNTDIPYFNAMIIITSMYLLTSITPSIFIFDVVIKSSIAIYLFSIIEISELTILCTVTLMWLLNFVLPSLFGSFYVLNFNLPKDKN